MLHDIIILVIGLLIGAVVAAIITGRVLTKKMKQQMISEDIIVALMSQMGRKPNKKQINQMMNTMKKYQ